MPIKLEDFEIRNGLIYDKVADCQANGGMCVTYATLAVKAEREAILKIIDKQEEAFLSSQYAINQPLSSMGERFACKQIRAAIIARGEQKG